MNLSYNWTLKDAVFTKDKGKVFSCFACGGGSTMGYKLAGFDVVGCNEIDPRMFEAYKANHNPKYGYLEPIQTFKDRNDLPSELFNLDILDGSPPCSTFSMAGNREEDWGKEKKFKEGQAKQVLDTLFFDFIDLAKKLQPKVVVAENVKGLLMGEAKEYVRKIYKELENAGYYVQHFLLDASTMGVPQKRERVFFIALRNDLAPKFLEPIDMFTVAPRINLIFKDELIPIKNFVKGQQKKSTQNYSANRFGDVMLNINKPCNTITTDINRYWLDENTLIDEESKKLIGSYPLDYNFKNVNPQYLIGMSVPPLMVARIANEIFNQWLSKL
jgi:DNA (cytosine-5)-methyltransferase 1